MRPVAVIGGARHRCAACLPPLAVVVMPPAIVPPITVVVPPVALLPLAKDKDVRRAASVPPIACPLLRTKFEGCRARVSPREQRCARWTAAQWERRSFTAAAAARERDYYYYYG